MSQNLSQKLHHALQQLPDDAMLQLHGTLNAADDAIVLRYCMKTFLEVDDRDWRLPNLCCEEKTALDYAGVRGFYSHFIPLTETDINRLTIPGNGQALTTLLYPW